MVRAPLTVCVLTSPALPLPLLLQVPVPEPGKYRVVLDSDALSFGGRGRVGHDVDHFTSVRCAVHAVPWDVL